MLRLIGITLLLVLGTCCLAEDVAADTPADTEITAIDISSIPFPSQDVKKYKNQRKSRSYADKIRGRAKKPQIKIFEPTPKYKKWDEVIRDADAFDGLFVVYKKREDVYFAIRNDQLDKPYLAVMSLSKGIGSHFLLGGLPIDDVMFDFHRVEDHIQMRRLNTRFRASGDSAIEKAIDLSYGISVLFSLPIESEDEDEGELLIKMDEVFLSDFSDLGYFMQMVMNRAVHMDRKKAVYNKIKSYPENVEIETALTYSPGDRRGLSLPNVPDSRFIEVGVHYSIIELPSVPMKPRLADDRIGYNTTPFKDFSRTGRESFMMHYINRWRLEKKDSSAALSEPLEPIVFYLDHTIPRHYRKYIAEGVEAWQQAFEEAGFENAIVAREAPEDPEFDPEDARYNMIRWIVSDHPVFSAIGPARVDPRTGEILSADVLIEASVLSNLQRAYRTYTGPDALAQIDPFSAFIDPETAHETDVSPPYFEYGRHLECSAGKWLGEGAALLRLALLSQGIIGAGQDIPDEYVGEGLRWLITHEVGHTLGLRHNFKSSISTPFEKLQDKHVVERIGLTGSVMDYAPPNISEDPDTQGYFYSPTVGTYDRWAIKWGYSEFPGESPEADREALEAIAEDAWKPEHAFGTDEDTYPAGALDPHCNIFDLGSDPLRYAEKHFRLVQNILRSDDLEERVCADGESYAPLRSAVEALIIQKYIAFSLAVKYVGGQYTERAHKGDPGDKLPLKPLTADEQRRALGFLIDHAFSVESFELPPELLNRLTDNKLRDWQNHTLTYGRRFDFPLLGWTGAIHYALLSYLLQPMLLQRILEAEYKVDDPFRLSELFGSLTRSIWLDHPTPEGKTAAMQRNLQRLYLNKLTQMVVAPFLGTPDDAIAIARLNLTRTRTSIDRALQIQGLDDETNAHLLESRARIDRALDANLQSGF